MRKTVLVLASGVLPELNNVSGPITHPTRIDIKNLKMLVKNNRNVQECDPEDPWNESKRVPLTMDNLITDNFTNKKVETPSGTSIGSGTSGDSGTTTGTNGS